MRPIEWAIALTVLAVAAHWATGRRAGRALAVVGLLLVVASVLVEGERTAMWGAYLVVVVAAANAWRAPRTPTPVRWWRHVGRGGLALVTVTAGVALPWLLPVLQLPAPPGPHRVGSLWLVVKDTTRRERFGPAAGGPREFPVRVWYPAAPAATGPTMPYATTREMQAVGLIPATFARQALLVKTHALANAPADSGRHPVLVFSHGFTSYAAQNTPQMEALASLGYIVASIAHPGEAWWAPFPDGRGIPMDTGVMNTMAREAKAAQAKGDPTKMMDSLKRTLAGPDRAERQSAFRRLLELTPEPLRSQSVAQWAADTRALVDHLEQLEAAPGSWPLAGRLDLAHLGVFGMSYGGATAGEFCRQDPRCKAGINLDGGMYGGLVDDSLSVPFLTLSSDENTSIHTPVLDLLRGPGEVVVFPKTTHLGFTDLTLAGPHLFGWLGITGRLDAGRREQMMTDYVVGWFEKHLMGRNAAWYDRLAAAHPDVRVVAKPAP